MKKYMVKFSMMTIEEYRKNNNTEYKSTELDNDSDTISNIVEITAETKDEAIEKAIECEYLALSEEVSCLRTASEIHIFADDLSFEIEMIVTNFRVV